MAIDTAAKRASAASDWLEQHIIPDGTLSQADRQTIAGEYGGILAGALVSAVECFVNLRSAIQEDLNIKSIVQVMNLKSIASSAMNLRSTIRTAFNLKSDVC